MRLLRTTAVYRHRLEGPSKESNQPTAQPITFALCCFAFVLHTIPPLPCTVSSRYSSSLPSLPPVSADPVVEYARLSYLSHWASCGCEQLKQSTPFFSCFHDFLDPSRVVSISLIGRQDMVDPSWQDKETTKQGKNEGLPRPSPQSSPFRPRSQLTTATCRWERPSEVSVLLGPCL
jgi:hypothetical protein